MEPNTTEDRKAKIKQWLTNKDNLLLIGIIVLTLIVRLYLFIPVQNQPVWWDESEYLASGKYIAGIVQHYDLNPQRPFLFLGAIALLSMIGASLAFIKLLLVVIPSIILVYCVFFLGKELFNRKIGLIAAFLTSFSWTLLFWGVRLQPDSISLCFQVLALAFMWRFWKKSSNSTTDVILAAVFASLGFQFKVSGMLVPAIIFIFALIKDRIGIIKNKQYWIFLLFFVLALAPQIIYSVAYFGKPLALFIDSGYAQVIGETRPLGTMTFDFIYSFSEGLIFIIFLVGLVSLASVFLYIDLLIKDKDKILSPELFTILSLAVITAFYVFYIRGSIEDRWVFLLIPFIFMTIGQGAMQIYAYVKPIHKWVAVILIVGLVAYGAYVQYQHANQIIDAKKTSYGPVRDAALFIKQSSSPGESILSLSYPQTIAYAERTTYTYSDLSETNFTRLLVDKRPTYLMVSLFEAAHNPPWMIRTGQQQNYYILRMDYMNSTLAADTQSGKIAIMDIKKSVDKPGFRFDLVYTSQDYSMFVYKITAL